MSCYTVSVADTVSVTVAETGAGKGECRVLVCADCGKSTADCTKLPSLQTKVSSAESVSPRKVTEYETD